MKKLLALLVLALIGLLILSSCERKEEPRPAPKRDWLEGRTFSGTKRDQASQRLHRYSARFASGQMHLTHRYPFPDPSAPADVRRVVEGVFSYQYDKPHCHLRDGIALEKRFEGYDPKEERAKHVTEHKADLSVEFPRLSIYVDEADGCLYLTLEDSDTLIVLR